MCDRMHLNGIAISIPKLDAITSDLMKLEDECKRQIYEYLPKEKLDGFTQAIAHEDDDPTPTDPKIEPRQEVVLSADDIEFNLNSGDQLAELLFKHLGIGPSAPGQKLKMTKSQTRLATDKKQLEILNKGEHAHPVLSLVLKYREAFKLRTTYTEKMPKIARFDSRTGTYRIYTTFTVTRTATGRLACVSGDTPLVTNRGTFTFSEYIPLTGDLVFTHKHRWRPVVRKFYKGIDMMYQVSLNSKHTIKCTADHRFYTPQGWQRLGDLLPGDELYVNIDQLCNRREEYTEGHRDLHIGRKLNATADCRQTGHYLPQRTWHLTQKYGAGSLQVGKGSTLLDQQDRGEEPYVWEVRGVTSQLEGGCGRSTRVSNTEAQWKEELQASFGNGERVRSAVGGDGQIYSTPCGWESTEQRLGQPSSDDSGGTPEDTFSTSYIRSIIPLGPQGVWDIEVEGDSSYITCGFYNHNSKNPNLMNLPFRTPIGRRIRAAFIPSPGKVFVGADFSQIELRLLAHCSADPNMLRIYAEGGDIHVFTAMRIFNKTMEEVVSKEGKTLYRLPAKRLGFGIAYGLAAQGLQQQLAMEGLNWTVEVCEEFIELWFNLYPGVRRLLETYYYRAKRYGFVWDLFGRIRLVPEVRSQHSWIRSAGLRQAGNMPIQGSAQAFTKLAMGYIEEDSERLRARGYGVEPLLQVHDEILLEVDEDIADVVADKMTYYMSSLDKLNHFDLRVPITAEAQIMPDCWKKSA